MIHGASARVNATQRRQHRQSDVPSERINRQRLRMYYDPPGNSIGLPEFWKLACERLKVLQTVDDLCQRFKETMKTDELDNALAKALSISSMPYMLGSKDMSFSLVKQEPPDDADEHLEYCGTSSAMQDTQKDLISHFILRLAFCKTSEQRLWFIQQEVELFKYRFRREHDALIDTFLSQSGFAYRQIFGQEKENLLNFFVAASAFQSVAFHGKETYYEVPFTEALDLVKHRKVYLRNGYAYVGRSDLVSIISGAFRANLSYSMACLAKHFDALSADERLYPLLRELNKDAYIGKDFAAGTNLAGGKITPAMLNDLSEISFPLCMRQLHQHVRKEHHMRHGGRMQFGLFLKGIGLTMEESLAYWRSEFTKSMDGDKFDKQYAYNIRHNYGKEGKRVDYTPYSCTKIISGNQPGVHDVHGCPFKHTDAAKLEQQLRGMRLNDSHVKSIMSRVRNGNFQGACTRFFEFTHKIPENMADTIGHPNQYFELSRKLLTGADAVGSATIKMEEADASLSLSAPSPTTGMADEEFMAGLTFPDEESAPESSVVVSDSAPA